MTATAMTPETLALELTNERAQFAELQTTWNSMNRDAAIAGTVLQADVAKQLRACGLRISQLERIQTPDPIPGYNDAGGAR
jgi:hypothetical protein